MNSRLVAFIAALISIHAVCAAVTSPNNLLLRVSFDTLPVKDDSPYQRNLVPSTGFTPALVAGKFGSAMRFNPNGGKTDAFFSGQWQSGPTFSAMAWVQFSELGGYPKILSQKNTFSDKGGWEFQYNAGAFSLVTGNGNNAASQQKTYELNTWYHIAMTVDNGAVAFYLNGADMTADGNADPIAPFGGKDVTVGSSTNAQRAVNDGGQWHGLLDEVRVYDFAMTAAQVMAVKNEDDSKTSVTNPNTPLTPIENYCIARNNSGAATSNIQVMNMELASLNGVTIPGRSNEYMSFSYYASHIADNGQVKTTGKLRIKNVGTGPLTINSIVVNPATQDTGKYFSASGIDNGQQIAAGATADITVNYNNYDGLKDKTVIHNFLVINSNDAVRPQISVTLAGIYMTKKEGGDEIALQSIVNSLGMSVNTGVGYVSEGIERLENNIIGDGFSSFLLKAADPAQPVWLQTAAGFSPCCTSSPGVRINPSPQGCQGVQLKAGYTQMVNPLNTDGSLAFTTCTVTNNFWLLQDGQWASNSPASSEGFISMHMAPARDEDGTLQANSYIVGQDYSLKTGCGFEQGQANCDFNDNVFYVTNVAPADSPALDRSAVVALPIKVSFDHSLDSGLVDANGNYVGFPQYTFSTVLDTSIRVKSYQPELLSFDPATKALKLRATAGNLMGETNNLVNGLRYPIDPAKRSFAVSSTVTGLTSLAAGISAGTFLGSDQDNYVTLTVSNGLVTAYAELYSFYQLQKGGDIGFEPTIKINAFTLGNVTLPSGTDKVELVIFASPVDNTVTFGYNLGNGVQMLDAQWTLPGRNPTTGLGSSGRILGFGVAGGIVAYGGDAQVSFTDFSISNCVASVPATPAPTTQAPSDSNNTPSDSNSNSPVSSNTSANNNPTDTNGPVDSDGNEGQTLTASGNTSSAVVIVPTLFAIVLALLSM